MSELGNPMTHLRTLSTKRVADNASQKIFTYNQRSRAFSAIRFTDEKSQLGGFAGEVMGSPTTATPFHRRNYILLHSRRPKHRRILSSKRAAENASQHRCAFKRQSRSFSATHFPDANSQLGGFDRHSVLFVDALTATSLFAQYPPQRVAKNAPSFRCSGAARSDTRSGAVPVNRTS